jgi:hypothetical protein
MVVVTDGSKKPDPIGGTAPVVSIRVSAAARYGPTAVTYAGMTGPNSHSRFNFALMTWYAIEIRPLPPVLAFRIDKS